MRIIPESNMAPNKTEKEIEPQPEDYLLEEGATAIAPEASLDLPTEESQQLDEAGYAALNERLLQVPIALQRDILDFWEFDKSPTDDEFDIISDPGSRSTSMFSDTESEFDKMSMVSNVSSTLSLVNAPSPTGDATTCMPPSPLPPSPPKPVKLKPKKQKNKKSKSKSLSYSLASLMVSSDKKLSDTNKLSGSEPSVPRLYPELPEPQIELPEPHPDLPELEIEIATPALSLQPESLTKPKKSASMASLNSDGNDVEMRSVSSLSSHKSSKKSHKKSKAVAKQKMTEREQKLNRDNRIFFGNQGEYVEVVWENGKLKEVTALQFFHPTTTKLVYIRKQATGYLLTYDADDFVARVSLGSLGDILFSKPANEVKQLVLKRVRILKVLEDRSLEARNEKYEALKRIFKRRLSQSLDDIDCAEDMYQLTSIATRTASSNFDWFLREILRNEFMSAQLKTAIEHYLETERIIKETVKDFSQFDQYSNHHFHSEMHQIYVDAVALHKKTLQDKYFKNICGLLATNLRDPFIELTGKGTLLVSRKDVSLFQDLVVLLQEHFWPGLVINSWDALFTKKIRTLSMSATLKTVAPITHPIYFYLCKSFQELVEEISLKTDIPITDLFLINTLGEWDLIENINWPKKTLLNRCLEQQYRFILRLIKHFEPGKYSSTKKFTRRYNIEKKATDVKRLVSVLSEANDDAHLVQSIANLFVGDTTVPEEHIVWTFIFDEALEGVLNEEYENHFKPLIEGFKEFIRKAPEGRYELFRVATHNTVRFIANTLPYLIDGMSSVDSTVLLAQINLINYTIQEGLLNDFRDLIDVFNAYWHCRETILSNLESKFPQEPHRSKLTLISGSLQNIAMKAFVDIEHDNLDGFVTFFRSFNEFIEDLNGLDFVWYIKADQLWDGTVLVNEQKRSYKVTNVATFIQHQERSGKLVYPAHYMIQTIDGLLECVKHLLDNDQWSQRTVLKGAGELLSAMRKSFLYFKEQPDYESFENFKNENVDPFLSAVLHSESYNDFKRRIEIVGDSFWYLRKQDEIDVSKALQLYTEINDNSIDQTLLKNSYDIYLTQFQKYIESTLTMSYEDKIEFVVKDVKKQLKKVKMTDAFSVERALTKIGISEGMKLSEWGVNFKKKDVPKLLSGLGVVWSILASKDISSTGKNLKPHCIQILCILRLLSVDKGSTGVDKHLTQVLTGQGKSLVLGLLSTLLALLGYDVRTMCYSSYLANRDGDDFEVLFEKFGVKDKITYGTFEDMANSILQPLINGKKTSLRDLVDERVLKHKLKVNGRIKRENLSNTILLIDEVDVFFTDKFYGNTYGACTTIGLSALAEIQEFIWKLVKSENADATIVVVKVKELIQSDNFQIFRELLAVPGKYTLLKSNDNIREVTYTNESLFYEHLDEMINCAIKVAGGTSKDWFISRFRITTKGIIAYRRDNGLYDSHCYPSYYNPFNYFRLKKVDFDHQSYKNYGYFNIHCGSISYAKLPEKYPLILGVSGTLKGLDVNEKRAVNETYEIKKISSMPSFFGRANLKFDPNVGFICESNEQDWLSRVFNSTNTAVDNNRSVLVFFKNDTILNSFKEKYLGKFDRLHVLTTNSETWEKKKYIDEAGISKTVTLATREMGRGLDFKSSVAVEKNGGVHVVQTFVSIDIKEETQIKGRTARKDNKGSYELIVCRSHLEKDGLAVSGESVLYHSVHTKRLELMTALRAKDNERIQASEEAHSTSLKYYESFFH